MELDFQFECVDTIFLLRDYQGKVVKVSKKILDSFYQLEFLGNDIYFDKETEIVWSKKTTSVTIDKQIYFQEEYINITNLWNQNQQLLDDLEKDVLTQISNLRAVENKKNEIIFTGKSCVIVMCDINSFKTINDVYGHVVGDHCLTQTAQLFNCFITQQDLVARVGGDEFLFIFLTDNIDAVAEKMKCIQEQVKDLGNSLHLPLSVSVGISLFQKGDNWEQKKAEADLASYQNKRITKQKQLY